MDIERAALHAQEARRLWSERHLHAAIREIERAVELDPENPSHHHGHGILLLELGDLHLAMGEFERAEELLASRPDLRPVMIGSIRFNQGHVHYRRGDVDAAFASWSEAYAEFEREGMADYQRMAAQNASWAASESGRADEARKWQDLAQPHVTTDDHRCRQRLIAAHVALIDGELTECLRLAEEIMRNDVAPADDRSFAASLAAMAGARSGQEFPARTMAKFAIDIAYQAGTHTRCWLFAAKADREVKKRFYREGAM